MGGRGLEASLWRWVPLQLGYASASPGKPKKGDASPCNTAKGLAKEQEFKEASRGYQYIENLEKYLPKR